MAAHESNQFVLPNGQSIEVRQLAPDDAQPTLTVMARAWEATYVASGWLPLDVSRSFTDPESDRLIDRLQGRMAAANEAHASNKPGVLYLGAFAVDEHGRREQVGMLKYSDEPTQTTLTELSGVGARRGEIDETDTLPGMTGRGIGRCMAYVALLHGHRLGHLGFGLEVVHGNTRARTFYTKHLGMLFTGATSLGEGMPPTMNRDVMAGIVPTALRTLNRLNSWLRANS